MRSLYVVAFNFLGRYTTLDFAHASGSGGCKMDLLGLYQWKVKQKIFKHTLGRLKQPVIALII